MTLPFSIEEERLFSLVERRHAHLIDYHYLINYCAWVGKIETVKWLSEMGFVLTDWTLEEAAVGVISFY